MNCEGARGSRLYRRENSDENECICETWSEKKKKMSETAVTECYCAFLSGRQNDFIACSLKMCSGGFSAPMMTTANLCKDMDYTGAKLASKHSIIHLLFSA